MVNEVQQVRNQASFEKIFGPIKRVGAVNNLFRQCRMPGDNYYSPSMEATPRMFGARLYTTGFHPASSDGTDIEDWNAVAEAVSIAKALASTLRGVMITSDTDCPYYPFVFPNQPKDKSLAKHIHSGLRCKTKKASDFVVRKEKKPEWFFWDEDDDPSEYYSPKEVTKCKKAAALLKSLTTPVKVIMPESFITYPIFLGGFTNAGLFAGVCGIRVDT